VKQMPNKEMRDPSGGRPGGGEAARASRPGRGRRALTLALLAVFGAAFALNAACGRDTPGGPHGGNGQAGGASSQHGPAGGSAVTASAGAETEGRDYSKFTHTNAEHARLPCLLCHRRPDNSPRPRLPGHQPCSGCHAQQFAAASAVKTEGGGAPPAPAASGGPMCAICHTGEGTAEVRPFPALKSFDARFDHALHAAGAARPADGCAACHKPARGGAALSIPAGLGAHTACFQCHSPRASAGDRDISSCATCHEPGTHRRTPQTARAFAVGFSHATHRRGLACADCHTVRAGAQQGRQVASPQPLMHHASGRARSCMSCHNNRRAFGGEDFGDCRRCHKGATWEPGG